MKYLIIIALCIPISLVTSTHIIAAINEQTTQMHNRFDSIVDLVTNDTCPDININLSCPTPTFYQQNCTNSSPQICPTPICPEPVVSCPTPVCPEPVINVSCPETIDIELLIEMIKANLTVEVTVEKPQEPESGVEEIEQETRDNTEANLWVSGGLLGMVALAIIVAGVRKLMGTDGCGSSIFGGCSSSCCNLEHETEE